MNTPNLPEFRAYPNVVQAIAYVELIIDGEPVEDSSWPILKTHVLAGKMSMTELINFLKDGCRDEITLGTQGAWGEALTQMDHPEFTTYLKGKLGAM